MDPFVLGARYPDGGPLFAEVDADDLIERLGGVTGDARRVAAAPWTFAEIKPAKQPRLDDPPEAGWAYVVAEDDPDRNAIIAAMEPLARARGMADPSAPLVVPAGADRGDWIDEVYKGLGDGRPRYLLLAGSPSVLGYPLQVDLAAAGALVGRVAFNGGDRLDAYAAYAQKVLRFDNGDPVPRRRATVVSTYGGPLDATVYSSRYLTPPVSDLLRKERFDVTDVTGKAATKQGVQDALHGSGGAVVFTATHGAGFPPGARGADPHAVNGAWACAPAEEHTPATAWDFLVAADLPGGTVTPGGLVAQFACFGYGTTDHSSFAAWLGNPNVIEADEPFVAAIPQRLLANPDGPIAYVGHVDIALAHGFVDPYDPPTDGKVHPRTSPFLSLLTKAIVELAPLGYAMRGLHERASAIASEIASTFDALEQLGIRVTDLPPDQKAKLIDKVIRRNDAMHFLLFGDPGARVRIDA